MAIYGFEFRATSGYVTTATNDTYSLGEISPVTRNGITFGWDADRTPQSRDRTTGSPNNPKLSGIIFQQNTNGQITFTVTLPNAGQWDIRAAFGDNANGQTQYVVLKDNTTAFATYSAVATSADQYMDAGGTVRTSAADWFSNNASLSRTFSSTTFNVVIGDPGSAAGNSSTVAYLEITSAGSSQAPRSIHLSRLRR